MGPEFDLYVTRAGEAMAAAELSQSREDRLIWMEIAAGYCALIENYKNRTERSAIGRSTATSGH